MAVRSGEDLTRLDLCRAELDGERFEDCRLVGADLSEAVLRTKVLRADEAVAVVGKPNDNAGEPRPERSERPDRGSRGPRPPRTSSPR